MSENYLPKENKIRTRISALIQKRLHLIFTAVTVLLTVIILGFLVYREREVLLTYEWHFRFWPAVLSFISFSLSMLFAAILWGWILNTLGGKLSFKKHIQYYCISNIAKRIPGTIWYVASRTQLYKEEKVDIRLTSIASGIEMALIILSGILVSALFAVPIILRYQISPWSLAVAFLVGLFLIHPRVIAKFFKLLKVEANILHYRNILEWLVTYIFLWVLGGIVLFSVGNAVTSIPIQSLGYIIGSWTLMGVLSSLLFFSPSNFGVTEIGLALLLGQIMPFSVGVVIALVARVLLIFYEIIWAVVFLGQKSLSKRD